MDKNLKCCFIGENNYPPFDYIEDGIPVGFNADITNAICKYIGVNEHIVLADWADVIDLSKTDTNFIFQGMFYSEDRAKNICFSNSYLSVTHSFFTNKLILDSLPLNSDGFTVGIQKHALTDDLLSGYNGKLKIKEIKYFSNHIELLKELFEGHINLVAGNRMTLLYLMNKYFKNYELKTIGEPIELSKLCYAVSPINKNKLILINEALEYINEKGIYSDIYEKWFGAIISEFDKHFIDTTDTAVIYIDALGKIIRLNKIAYDLLGDIEVEGMSIFNSDIKCFIPESVIRRVMDGYEESIIDKTKVEINGYELYISYCATPVRNHNGDINGAILSIKDETKEINLDKKLKNYDKLHSLSRIVGSVAHEIKNPLTSIKNYIDLLPKLYDDIEFRESIINNIPQQVEIINELINELLQYTTPQIPFMEIINCNEIITKTINLIKFNKKIFIHNLVDENLMIRIDKKNFRQIITNIVLNAMESSDEGDCIKIRSEVEPGSDYCNIYIEDEGHGIKEEYIDYVFEPFYTDKENGTGLGLYICHQLITENKGYINLKSDGNGTVVILTLLRYLGERYEDDIDC